MHFAFPPRKTSAPPPYTRIKNAANTRRAPWQYVIYGVVGILSTYYLCSRWFSFNHSESSGQIEQDASVLIVTVFDESQISQESVSIVKQNREDYAARHGYKTYFTNVTRYSHLTGTSPSSWALVPAVRHALTLFPEVDYIWSLTPHALIMNSTLSLHDHIFARLNDIMLKDIPVVPPDSVIHTFSHLKPDQVHLIIGQDADNLAHTSFLLRNSARVHVDGGESQDNWAYYLLDAWFDPLYRAYAFQKAENHALEHIVQWHSTLLAKLALIDQRLINSYTYQSTRKKTDGGQQVYDSKWQPGDLVLNFKGCDTDSERDCGREISSSYKKWAEIFRVDETDEDIGTAE